MEQTNATYHRYSAIYDRLNNQPHLQELIATPLLQQLDLEDAQEDWALYNMRAKAWQNLCIYDLNTTIQSITWDPDTAPGSFASYILYAYPYEMVLHS